jgi:hypothetical protein
LADSDLRLVFLAQKNVLFFFFQFLFSGSAGRKGRKEELTSKRQTPSSGQQTSWGTLSGEKASMSESGSRDQHPLDGMAVDAPPPADQGDIGVLLDAVHHDAAHGSHHLHQSCQGVVDSVMNEPLEPINAVVEALAGVQSIAPVAIINASHVIAMPTSGSNCEGSPKPNLPLRKLPKIRTTSYECSPWGQVLC